MLQIKRRSITSIPKNVFVFFFAAQMSTVPLVNLISSVISNFFFPFI